MKRFLIHSMVSAALVSVAFAFHSCSPKAENASEAKIEIVNLDIQVLKDQFTLNSKTFNNALADISNEEADQRINGTTNSIKWITGHTLDIGYNLAALLGMPQENPYAADFGFGKPFKPDADYPTLDQMLSDWNALAPKIESAIGTLSQEQLNADPPFPIPYKEQSIRGLLSFQMHHISYEVGQLGLYRRFLGKAPMSYQ